MWSYNQGSSFPPEFHPESGFPKVHPHPMPSSSSSSPQPLAPLPSIMPPLPSLSSTVQRMPFPKGTSVVPSLPSTMSPPPPSSLVHGMSTPTPLTYYRSPMSITSYDIVKDRAEISQAYHLREVIKGNVLQYEDTKGLKTAIPLFCDDELCYFKQYDKLLSDTYTLQNIVKKIKVIASVVKHPTYTLLIKELLNVTSVWHTESGVTGLKNAQILMYFIFNDISRYRLSTTFSNLFAANKLHISFFREIHSAFSLFFPGIHFALSLFFQKESIDPTLTPSELNNFISLFLNSCKFNRLELYEAFKQFLNKEFIMNLCHSYRKKFVKETYFVADYTNVQIEIIYLINRQIVEDTNESIFFDIKKKLDYAIFGMVLNPDFISILQPISLHHVMKYLSYLPSNKNIDYTREMVRALYSEFLIKADTYPIFLSGLVFSSSFILTALCSANKNRNSILSDVIDYDVKRNKFNAKQKSSTGKNLLEALLGTYQTFNHVKNLESFYLALKSLPLPSKENDWGKISVPPDMIKYFSSISQVKDHKIVTAIDNFLKYFIGLQEKIHPTTSKEIKPFLSSSPFPSLSMSSSSTSVSLMVPSLSSSPSSYLSMSSSPLPITSTTTSSSIAIPSDEEFIIDFSKKMEAEMSMELPPTPIKRTALTSSQINLENFEALSETEKKQFFDLYEALIKSVTTSWKQKDVQENLRKLLTTGQGKRGYNLLRAKTELGEFDKVGIKKILDPFISSYFECCKSVGLGKSSPIAEFCFRDILKFSRLEGLFNVEDDFYKLLREIYPDIIGFPITINILNQNAKNKPKLSPIEFSSSKNHEYALGLRDLLFDFTIKELELRSKMLLEVLKQQPHSAACKNEDCPKHSLKYLDACYMYAVDDAIEVYPLRIAIEPGNYSIIGIGADDDKNSVSKRLQKAIPCLTSPSVSGKKAFMITAKESIQLLEFYSKNKDDFYLLTSPPKNSLKVDEKPFTGKKGLKKGKKDVSSDSDESESKEEAAGERLPWKESTSDLSSPGTKKESTTTKEKPETPKSAKSKGKSQVHKSLPSYTEMGVKEMEEDEDYVDVDGDFEEESKEVFETEGFEEISSPKAEKEKIASAFPVKPLFSITPTVLKNPFESVLREYCSMAEQRLNRCVEKQIKKEISDKELLKMTDPIATKLSAIKPILAEDIAFEDSLKPYQKESVAWMLSLARVGLGSILASEPGLGKTRQTIEFIRQMQKADKHGLPTLIVVPKSIIAQWKEELLTRFYESRRKHIEFLLGNSDRLSSKDVEVLCNGIGILATSHEEQLETLKKERIELEKNFKKEKPDSKEFHKAQRILDQCDSEIKKFYERKSTDQQFMIKAVQTLPDMKEPLLKLWELGNAQRSLWLNAFLLSSKNDIGLKEAVLGAFKHHRYDILRKQLINIVSQEKIDTEKLCQVLDKADLCKFTIQKADLFDFFKKIITTEKTFYKSTSSSSFLTPMQIDHSLLMNDLYSQVIEYTSKNAKEIELVLKNINVCSSWKIILTTSDALSLSKKSVPAKEIVVKKIKTIPFKTIVWDEAHISTFDLAEVSEDSKKLNTAQKNLELLKTIQINSPETSIALLTGTPFINKYSETLSLLQMANPLISFERIARQLERTGNYFGKTIEKWISETENSIPTRKLKSHLSDAFSAYEHIKWIHKQLIRTHRNQDIEIQRDWTVTSPEGRQEVFVPKKVCYEITCGITEQQEQLLAKTIKVKNFFTRQSGIQQLLFHPKMLDKDLSSLKRKELKERMKKLSLEELDKFIAESGFLETFLMGDPLNNAVKDGKSILIIVPVIKQGQIIKESLKKIFPTARVMFFYGEKSMDKRDRIVKEFEAAKTRPQIIVLSADAGGVGLNLKSGDIVFNLAPWWNDAVAIQAEARILRAGAKGEKPVYTYDSGSLHEQHTKQVVHMKNLAQKYFFTTSSDIAENLKAFLNYYEGKILGSEEPKTKESWKNLCDNNQADFVRVKEALLSNISVSLSQRIDSLNAPKIGSEEISLGSHSLSLSSSSSSSSSLKSLSSLSSLSSSSSSSLSSLSSSSSSFKTTLSLSIASPKNVLSSSSSLSSPSSSLSSPSSLSTFSYLIPAPPLERPASKSISSRTVTPMESPKKQATSTMRPPDLLQITKPTTSTFSSLSSLSPHNPGAKRKETASASEELPKTDSLKKMRTTPQIPPISIPTGLITPTSSSPSTLSSSVESLEGAGKEEKEKKSTSSKMKIYVNPEDPKTKLSLLPLMHEHSYTESINVSDKLFKNEGLLKSCLKNLHALTELQWTQLLDNPDAISLEMPKIKDWKDFHSAGIEKSTTKYKVSVFTIKDVNLELCKSECLNPPGSTRTVRLLKTTGKNGKPCYDILLKN